MTGRDGDELIRRIADPDRTAKQRGNDAYELLQALFSGHPISGLGPLLRSKDSRVVEAGIWVLAELGSKASPLVKETGPLLDHPSRTVRYWAIDVVNVGAGPEDGEILGKALKLLEDTDGAVRGAALFFLARMSDPQLSAAIDRLEGTDLGDLLGWLRLVQGGDVADAEVVNRVASDVRLVRMVAVAAAARISHRGRPALERAAAMGDEDTSVFASGELERMPAVGGE